MEDEIDKGVFCYRLLVARVGYHRPMIGVMLALPSSLLSRWPKSTINDKMGKRAKAKTEQASASKDPAILIGKRARHEYGCVGTSSTRTSSTGTCATGTATTGAGATGIYLFYRYLYLYYWYLCHQQLFYRYLRYRYRYYRYL